MQNESTEDIFLELNNQRMEQIAQASASCLPSAPTPYTEISSKVHMIDNLSLILHALKTIPTMMKPTQLSKGSTTLITVQVVCTIFAVSYYQSVLLL